MATKSVVSGIYGGGPIYMDGTKAIQNLKSSGFSEVIVWNIAINKSGDLNFNDEFPLIKDGKYIGDDKHPQFKTDMASLKSASSSVTKLTFSLGSSHEGTFEAIKSLVESHATESNGILYQNFQALKATFPSLDALDFDDETCYDARSMKTFSIMLGNLGFKVALCPYSHHQFWKDVASDVNKARADTINAVHLQCYDGGVLNSPNDDWDFGGIPVYPGLWDKDSTTDQVKDKMIDWKKKYNISGGFIWLYDDFYPNALEKAQAYAKAVNDALG